MLLTSNIVKFLTKTSDQRKRKFYNGALAPIGWRSYRPMNYKTAPTFLGLILLVAVPVFVIGDEPDAATGDDVTLAEIKAKFPSGPFAPKTYDKSLIPQLLDYLTHSDPRVVIYACELIEVHPHDRRMIKALLKLLNHADNGVRTCKTISYRNWY